MAGRILLVGEMDDDLSKLSVKLRSLGLSVEMAPDGLSGLERGRDFQPDLVITEILTRRLNGFELSSRIVSGSAGFSAPVIFYTEFYRDEKARREVLSKCGALHYFVKPFQKEALKKAVTSHFQEFLSRAAFDEASKLEETPATDSMPEALESPLSRAAVAAEMASFPPTDHAATQPRPASEPADPIHKIETTRLPAFDRSVKAVETPLPERPLDQGSVSSSSESLFESFRADNAKRESEVESSEATRNERHLVFANLAASKSSPVVWSTRIRVAVLLILLVAGLYVASNRLSFVYKEKGALRPAIKTAPAPQKEQSLPAEAEILPATPSLPRSSAEVEETSPAPAPPPAVESGSSEQHIPSLPDVSNKAEEDSGLEETPNVPEVTISDVTGSVSGPYLRDGKYPPLPAEAIRSLGEKALVLRVVVNRTGEVVEVTPLTPDGKSAASPESVLAAVRKWRFTPLRRKDEATAVKYYSFKVESQPR